MYFDSIQWSHPSTTLLSGPSSSGKTVLLTKILENQRALFGGDKIQTILFYSIWQPIYDQWLSSGLIAYTYKGIPTLEDFKSLCIYYTLENGVSVIFDDLGSLIPKNLIFFEEIFVVLSHHLRISVLLILHNLYEKGLRKISLNSNRIILTNNSRDTSQITFFARQSFPGTKNFLPAVFKYICNSSSYGHLVLDFCQGKDKYLRVTSNWFNNKSPIMSFIENSDRCSSDDKTSFLCYYLIPSTIYNLLSKNTQIVNNVSSTSGVSSREVVTPQESGEVHYHNVRGICRDNHVQPNHSLDTGVHQENDEIISSESSNLDKLTTSDPIVRNTPSHPPIQKKSTLDSMSTVNENLIARKVYPPFSKGRKSKVIKEINVKKKNKRVKKVLPKKGALGDVIDLLSYTPFDDANSPNNKIVLSPNHKDIQADDVGVEDIPTNSNGINQDESNTLSHKNNTTPLDDKRWNGRERLLRKYANVRKKKKGTPRLNIIDAPASDDSKTILPNTYTSLTGEDDYPPSNLRSRGVKRSKRDDLKREIPPKKKKINRGEKRTLNHKIDNPKKQKVYHVKNYANNNSNYETWRL